MKVTAAVATAPKTPFEIVDLSLDEPRPNEVRVKLVATGVCQGVHSPADPALAARQVPLEKLTKTLRLRR